MKKVIALTVAVLMFAGILAGCKVTPGNSSDSSSVSSSEELKEPGIVRILGIDPANETDPEDMIVFKTLEEKLNVDLQWELVPSSQYEAVVSTRIAAGSLDADIFKSGTATAEQLSASGAIVKISDYFNTLCPNIKKALEENEYLRTAMTSPDGGVWFLPKYYGTAVSEYPMIRQDWLDKLKIGMPKTLDDLYNYLVLVKKTDLNGNGKNDEIPWLFANFKHTFIYSCQWFGIEPVAIWYYMGLDESGEVYNYLPTDNFKQCMMFLNKCFTEGLINNDLPNMASDAFKKYMLNDQVGFITSNGASYTADWDGQIKAVLPNTTAAYVYMTPPDAGFKTTGVRLGGISSTLHYVAASGNVEDALRVFDYVFGEEGALLTWAGLDGKTYVKNSDGSLSMGPYISGMKPASEIPNYLYNLGALGTGANLPINVSANVSFFNTLFAQGGDRHIKTIQDIMSNAKISQQAEVMFRFTDEEGKYLTENLNTMRSYTWEELSKFIYGTRSFDTWDDFVSTLKTQYKLDSLVDIYKTAYARSAK